MVGCILYFIWLCDIIVCQIPTSLNLVRMCLVAATEIRDQDREVHSISLSNSSFYARKVQLGWSSVSGGIIVCCWNVVKGMYTGICRAILIWNHTDSV